MMEIQLPDEVLDESLEHVTFVMQNGAALQGLLKEPDAFDEYIRKLHEDKVPVHVPFFDGNVITLLPGMLVFAQRRTKTKAEVDLKDARERDAQARRDVMTAQLRAQNGQHALDGIARNIKV